MLTWLDHACSSWNCLDDLENKAEENVLLLCFVGSGMEWTCKRDSHKRLDLVFLESVGCVNPLSGHLLDELVVSTLV